MTSISINEFVPNLDLLRLYAKDPTPPPLPTEEDMEELHKINMELKGYFKEYREIMDDDMNTPPEDPRAIELLDLIRKAQVRAMNKQNYIDTLNRNHSFHHSVQILLKFDLAQLIESFEHPLNTGIPSITYFLLKYEDIVKSIQDNDDYMFFRKFDIIPSIVKKKRVRLNLPVNIPNYNLLHIGNICHFNACMNILSSMTILIQELSKLKADQKLTVTAGNIFQYILNSHSFLDLNPSLLLKIISSLGLSMTEMDEANETMKKILRSLYKSGLSLNTVFYWDTSDEFYKTKELNHPLSTKLSELHPTYFLCNIHDFNSVYNIDQRTIQLQAFDITLPDEKIDCSYALTSFIIFNSSHYTSAFIHDPMLTDQEKLTVDIRNDMNDRYTHQTMPLAYTFSGGNQHVLGLYVRQDLLPVTVNPA